MIDPDTKDVMAFGAEMGALMNKYGEKFGSHLAVLQCLFSCAFMAARMARFPKAKIKGLVLDMLDREIFAAQRSLPAPQAPIVRIGYYPDVTNEERTAMLEARDALADAITWLCSLHPMKSRIERITYYKRAHGKLCTALEQSGIDHQLAALDAVITAVRKNA